MDLVKLNVFSVGNSPAGMADAGSLAGGMGNLSQEFSQMLHALRQSKLSNSEEANIASYDRTIPERDGVEANPQSLKDLVDFMFAVESQLDHVNGKITNALPVAELENAFSDLLGFLMALSQHFVGGDEAVLSTGENQTTTNRSLIMEQKVVNDFIEFEYLLNDLSNLFAERGALEKASAATGIDVKKILMEQTLGKSDANEYSIEIPTTEKSRLQTPYELAEHLSGDAEVSELKPPSKIDKETTTRSISIPSDELASNYDEVTTSADATSPTTTFDISAEHNLLQDADVTKKLILEETQSNADATSPTTTSDISAAHNLFQDADVNKKRNVEEAQAYTVATSPTTTSENTAVRNLFQGVDENKKLDLKEALVLIRALVAKLRMNQRDQPLSLTHSDQTKLVEATKRLMSIDFENVIPGKNLETEKCENFVHTLYGAKAGKATDPGDLQTIEVLAQSVWDETENHTRPHAAQTTRTSYATFPPVFDSTAFTIDAERYINLGLYIERKSPILFAASKLEENLVPSPETDKNNQVSPGSKGVNRSNEIDIILKPAPTGIKVHDGDVISTKDGDPQNSTLTNTNVNLMSGSTTAASSTDAITHDVKASVDIKTAALKAMESISESNVGPKAVDAESPSQTEEPQKLQNIPLQRDQAPVQMHSPLKYKLPSMQWGNASSENVGTVQAITDAKGKYAAEQNPMNSAVPRGAKVETKFHDLHKPQADKQTPNIATASSKTALRRAISMSESKIDKYENIINDEPKLTKQTIAKKFVPASKPHSVGTDKSPFELPQPRLKQRPLRQESSSKLRTVTSFSAKAADAIISHVQSQTRKKDSEAVNTAPFAVMHVEAGTLQQTPNINANHNAGNQINSGSERFEKWVDTHLDVTSRGWMNNLSKTMASAINRGQQRLMLVLSPPSLGRISIVFSAKPAGLDLRLHAERKATLALLGDAEAKLVSNLENSGHKINNLSYAEMGSSAKSFDFDYNQSAKGDTDDTGQRDHSEQENASEIEQVAKDKAAVKNIDDASLVNITV